MTARKRIGILAAAGLFLPLMAAAQTRAPTQNEVIEQGRKDIRASEREAARNLDRRDSPDQIRLRKAIESGDSAEAMRLMNELYGDTPLSGGPGDLKAVYSVGGGSIWGGVIPVSPPKRAKKPPVKKPVPVAASKNRDESNDAGGNGPDPKLKKELADRLWQKREVLDAILRHKDQLPDGPHKKVLEADMDKEADLVRTEIRKAEKRYTDYLYVHEPNEYQQYVDQRRRIHDSPLEARPIEMRDQLRGGRVRPDPLPPRPERPQTPPLKDYDD